MQFQVENIFCGICFLVETVEHTDCIVRAEMKVLSVEIGVDITHVLEIEGEVKNPKIYSFFSFATPVGMIGDGIVKRNEEFKKSLQKGKNLLV